MQTSGPEACDHDVMKYTQSVGEDDRILSDVFCIGIWKVKFFENVLIGAAGLLYG